MNVNNAKIALSSFGSIVLRQEGVCGVANSESPYGYFTNVLTQRQKYDIANVYNCSWRIHTNSLRPNQNIKEIMNIGNGCFREVRRGGYVDMIPSMSSQRVLLLLFHVAIKPSA